MNTSSDCSSPSGPCARCASTLTAIAACGPNPPQYEAQIIDLVMLEVENIIGTILPLLKPSNVLARILVYRYFGAHHSVECCHHTIKYLANYLLPITYIVDDKESSFESLEQLPALHHGNRIYIHIASAPPPHGLDWIGWARGRRITLPIKGCLDGSMTIYPGEMWLDASSITGQSTRPLAPGDNVGSCIRSITKTFIHEMTHVLLRTNDQQIPWEDYEHGRRGTALPFIPKTEVITAYGLPRCRILAQSLTKGHLAIRNADSLALFICHLYLCHKYPQYSLLHPSGQVVWRQSVDPRSHGGLDRHDAI